MQTNQLEKLKQQKLYLTIGVFLTVIAFFWVVISIVSTNTSDQLDPKIKQAAKLFSPVIDTSVFDQLTKKTSYATEQLEQFAIYKLFYSKQNKKPLIVPIDFDETLLSPTPTPKTVSPPATLNSAETNQPAPALSKSTTTPDLTASPDDSSNSSLP